MSLGLRAEHPAASVVPAAFAAGSLPFSQWAARLFAQTDLRRSGTGTVSGSGLYEVAGFGPLALAGSLDVAKGAFGPLLAGHHRPWLAAAATAATLSGHNWSPWLRGAGGRGLAPALGAMVVSAPEGAALLAGAMAAGRLARQSAVVTLGATCALVGLLARRGPSGVALGLAVAVPVVAKRVAGNRAPGDGDRRAVAWSRLLFDRDPQPG